MKPILVLLITSLVAQASQVHGLWLFQQTQSSQDDSPSQDLSSISSSSSSSPSSSSTSHTENDLSFTEHLTHIAAKQLATQFEQAPKQEQKSTQQQKGNKLAGHSHKSSTSGSSAEGTGYNYGSYGSGLLSIAGIQPASISTLLGTVGDTGFRYFNIQDQCRNRAACDLGAMLYKKLSFIHNWLVRTSVRSLADMNNIYMQSWMEGMTGRNCTAVYVACRQSPLEGLMNLAMLQNLVY